MGQTDPKQNTPSFDPFEVWRQLYEANEQAWTKAVKEMTTTQDYAEAQGKMLESMLAFQKMMRENMSAQLSNLNVPTRDDVSRLGELVLGLEEKVDGLDDHFPILEGRLADLDKKIDAIARLEKKVDKLAETDRLAELEKRVESIDRRIAGLADRVAREVQKEVQASAPEPDRTERTSGGRSRGAERS